MKNEADIIGIPLDLGAGRRGVDMGPSASRIANVGPRISAPGYRIDVQGNIPVPISEGIGAVEVNPALDTQNSAAIPGCELILSALGKKIL